MNLKHHTEQMEAVRRDFRKHWESEWLPYLKDAGFKTFNELAPIEYIAWHAFRAGLNIKNPS